MTLHEATAADALARLRAEIESLACAAAAACCAAAAAAACCCCCCICCCTCAWRSCAACAEAMDCSGMLPCAAIPWEDWREAARAWCCAWNTGAPCCASWIRACRAAPLGSAGQVSWEIWGAGGGR